MHRELNLFYFKNYILIFSSAILASVQMSTLLYDGDRNRLFISFLPFKRKCSHGGWHSIFFFFLIYYSVKMLD